MIALPCALRDAKLSHMAHCQDGMICLGLDDENGSANE